VVRVECETLSVTFGGDANLRVFEIKACRKALSTKSEEVTRRLDEMA
jgi:hypothetical protein